MRCGFLSRPVFLAPLRNQLQVGGEYYFAIRNSNLAHEFLTVMSRDQRYAPLIQAIVVFRQAKIGAIQASRQPFLYDAPDASSRECVFSGHIALPSTPPVESRSLSYYRRREK